MLIPNEITAKGSFAWKFNEQTQQKSYKANIVCIERLVYFIIKTSFSQHFRFTYNVKEIWVVGGQSWRIVTNYNKAQIIARFPRPNNTPCSKVKNIS